MVLTERVFTFLLPGKPFRIEPAHDRLISNEESVEIRTKVKYIYFP
jgi:hypothetical protein